MHRFGAPTVVAMACIAGCIAPAAAQEMDVQPPAVQHYQDCMDDAIAGAAITTTDYGAAYYTCGGEVANRWFNFLARVRTVQIQRRDGIWLQRAVSGGTCWRKLESRQGGGVDNYSCVISVQNQ
jgi:hypothetical protein